ncbi:MAG: gluconate 2-dehydrogenase subunit 3 family protein [bacterium]|nr:gluconate 2-dehydrogenase subunit 3 family protein [bacterium]
MKRREVLKSALLGAGALQVPGVPPAGGSQVLQGAAAADEDWKPKLLDAHQNETVIALTELIIPQTDTPGAKAALVNRYVDLALADGDLERGRRFRDGLASLDGLAIQQHNSPFVRCSEAQQAEMLASLKADGSEFFAELKRLTIEGYYTSKIGIDELNKHGVPETFACDHIEHA